MSSGGGRSRSRGRRVGALKSSKPALIDPQQPLINEVFRVSRFSSTPRSQAKKILDTTTSPVKAETSASLASKSISQSPSRTRRQLKTLAHASPQKEIVSVLAISKSPSRTKRQVKTLIEATSYVKADEIVETADSVLLSMSISLTKDALLPTHHRSPSPASRPRSPTPTQLAASPPKKSRQEKKEEAKPEKPVSPPKKSPTKIVALPKKQLFEKSPIKINQVGLPKAADSPRALLSRLPPDEATPTVKVDLPKTKSKLLDRIRAREAAKRAADALRDPVLEKRRAHLKHIKEPILRCLTLLYSVKKARSMALGDVIEKLIFSSANILAKDDIRAQIDLLCEIAPTYLKLVKVLGRDYLQLTENHCEKIQLIVHTELDKVSREIEEKARQALKDTEENKPDCAVSS